MLNLLYFLWKKQDFNLVFSNGMPWGYLVYYSAHYLKY